MRISVVLPTTEIGNDPAVIRDYVRAVEALGCDDLVIYDEVLLSDPYKVSGISEEFQYYTLRNPFHEPLTLLAFIAGVTTKIGLGTSVLVAPMRDTALIAKQAAQVDILSNGRMRLGLGLGWNKLSYEGVGQDFHTRGRRLEEQVGVLRALWTQTAVNFKGEWHHITHSGISPKPVQMPIPIWFGGGAERVIDRIARLGDGWFPEVTSPNAAVEEKLVRLGALAKQAGRDPAAIGVEGKVSIGTRPEEEWAKEIDGWRRLNATHISVDTMAAGFATLGDHVRAIEKFVKLVRG
ncbi:MAG: LLM class F420-dependent oxidoreductase [SAR202 cluster bacterium]|nr:LLM class F420-dependent oxidoreductase [SAR202 cluster bacterium]